MNEVKIIANIQINGSGKKEIILLRKCSISSTEQGDSIDNNEMILACKYEVWDLDKKELLFEDITFYSDKLSQFNVPKNKGEINTFSCDFKIDTIGRITLSMDVKICKTTTTYVESENIVIPYYHEWSKNKELGTFEFQNGKYLKVG